MSNAETPEMSPRVARLLERMADLIQIGERLAKLAGPESPLAQEWHAADEALLDAFSKDA